MSLDKAKVDQLVADLKNSSDAFDTASTANDQAQAAAQAAVANAANLSKAKDDARASEQTAIQALVTYVQSV